MPIPDLVDITQIAQDYGMTAIRMNQTLHELGVQFKDNDLRFRPLCG